MFMGIKIEYKYQTSYDSFKREAGKSVRAFAFRVQKLLRKGYPTLVKGKKKKTIEQFQIKQPKFQFLGSKSKSASRSLQHFQYYHERFRPNRIHYTSWGQDHHKQFIIQQQTHLLVKKLTTYVEKGVVKHTIDIKGRDPLNICLRAYRNSPQQREI